MTQPNKELSAEHPLLTRPRAIIVGASSGIGAALARKLAREGYAIALLARRADKLNALCAEINQELDAEVAQPYVHDVTDFDQTPALFQQIIADLGQLDLMVYNAGNMPNVGLAEYNFEKDRQMIEVNLLGAMAWLDQAAALFDATGSGQIVGVSSIAGERGRVGNPPYHTAKAGLSTFLESLRNRLTRKGVHVLTVKPGYVDTELLQAAGGANFWVISPEQAADDSWKAIRKRRQVIFTPARWRLVGLVLQHIPSIIFRRLSF